MSGRASDPALATDRGNRGRSTSPAQMSLGSGGTSELGWVEIALVCAAIERLQIGNPPTAMPVVGSSHPRRLGPATVPDGIARPLTAKAARDAVALRTSSARR